MRSRARSRPAFAHASRDGRKAAVHEARNPGAPATDTPARCVRSISRTMARDTRSRDARSPAGSYRVMNRSPASLISRAPSPRSASDSRKRGAPGTFKHRRMELDELEIGDMRRPPPPPSRSRRRWQSTDSWSRETPGPRRRLPAASATTAIVPLSRSPADVPRARHMTPSRTSSSVALVSCSTRMRPFAAHSRPEQPADLAPRRIARVQHPPDAVRGLARQRW